ncbi:hypothetical protein DL93DRAFT_2083971 [Clavulina sp. PMI_390]|nr:hypothetical protein DL93DRAFT_2083971 [Clavulina sp. PMI_390]
MQKTQTLWSKASRLALTPKMGNKDFYKGTGAAFVPGGHRTGAPGSHIIQGSGKYRLFDNRVRYFVSPPIQEIQHTRLRPYVHTGVDPRSLATPSSSIPSSAITPSLYVSLSQKD